MWVQKFFLSIDHFIAVSHNTKKLLIQKGIKRQKITVIPNGFDFAAINSLTDRKKVDKLLHEHTEKKVLLLTLGRLVKRKGVAWFITNVLPFLPKNIIYIVAGCGPEREKLHRLVKSNNLASQVKLLGRVCDIDKEILLSNCDLFIQPNIKVNNDVEGFGISVIEASAYNLPVIAANLEGLKDAIVDNKNGWLVTSEHPDAYIQKINSLITNMDKLKSVGKSFKKHSQKNYDWKYIIKRYLKLIDR